MKRRTSGKTIGVRGQGFSFFSAGMGQQSVLGGMCPPSYCPVNCPNGLRHGPNGCSICQCAPSAEANLPGGDPAHQGGASMMGGGFLNSGNYTKPCILNMICPFHCPQGYATGPDGCQFCICAAIQPVSTTVQPVLSPETFTKPCPEVRPGCDKNCTYGYVRGPRGCQYCTCQSPPGTFELTENYNVLYI
ncbi:hypothetical protein CHS0354_008445 [Potamilus streckersoni]|uniref:Antistasin-like domain-containing protein n=1 Tax=Potamilus streckersoni TaxID=2493646 RepID=A0AAE0RPP3_9BIVA|nr:hypothetical protein CHS0354_008445 [Potamilus streckersoni]